MTFSLVSAGSPAVPRAAAGWLRATALPAVALAIREVSAARDRAVLHFVGRSGGAYSVHVGGLLGHLSALESRLSRAALLVESYADRLVAHELLLASVRARALSAGLSVVGDSVPAPTDLLASVTWSELAGEVAREQSALLGWVRTELEPEVARYADPDLSQWAADFIDANRVGLAASGLETTATRGGALLSARGLLDSADRLEQLSRIPGPASTLYDTVTALEGDTPAEGLVQLGGSAAAVAATTATVALLAPAAPVLAVGVLTVAAGAAGTLAARGAWSLLPERTQDDVDGFVGEVWDDTKDVVTDAAGGYLDHLRTWAVAR